MTDDRQVLWEQIKEILRRETSGITFNAWFRDLEVLPETGPGITLVSPNLTSYSFINEYLPRIRQIVSTLDPHTPALVNLLLRDEKTGELSDPGMTAAVASPPPRRRSEPVHSVAASVAAPARTPTWTESYDASRLDPLMTFENFIVGSGNRFAHAACEAVAKQGGDRNYNPLFIYGGSGLGKTHLMMAIGNYVQTHQPRRRMIYVQCEQIVNEFVAASRNNRYEEFRNKYRSCDLLLIDDIQLLTGKDRTKEEFFNTFNALFVNDRNIVMTCDKPPQSLTTIEERLVTRFSSGLIADIQAPDYETRLAILLKLADQSGLFLPDDVADYIAANIRSSIRELEGAFKTVSAYSLLAGELSLPIVRDALKDLISPTANRKVTTQIIMDVVARYFNLRTEDLVSKRRNKDIAEPRSIAMYLCREVLSHPYEQIGRDFNRHYSTVIYSCDKIGEELRENPDSQLAADVIDIRRRIEN